MSYQEIKEKLEALKQELVKKLQSPTLLVEERESIKKLIFNYEYIIELTDMNHFERGKIAL